MGKKSLFNIFSKKEEKLNSKAVSVLGSGRCGTSMAARAINFIGVDLGSGFIKGNQTNPKGFWEHKGIVNIHKKIKSELGKRPFPEGWKDFENIKPLKQDMKNLIVEEFSDKPIWGWKDPRTCESIDMWIEILSDLDIEGNYIIMIRNPIDVAASYKKAYDRKEDSAIKQWQMRTLLSLMGTENDNRLIIDYDDFLENSFDTVKKVSESFNLNWDGDEVQLKQELDSFIDPNLRHSRTSLEELDEDTEISDDIKELYKLCLKGARSEEFLQSNEFSQELTNHYQKFIKQK